MKGELCKKTCFLNKGYHLPVRIKSLERTPTAWTLAAVLHYTGSPIKIARSLLILTSLTTTSPAPPSLLSLSATHRIEKHRPPATPIPQT
jgi:hypothetical protein